MKSQSLGGSVGNNGFTANIGMSEAESSADQTTFTNSLLTAQNGSLNINTAQDSSLLGANLLASDIKLEIGGNLLLKSRQNLSESDSYNIGMSLGISGNSSGANGGSEGSQELIDGGNLTINTRSLKSWLNDCNQNCLRSKLHYKTQLNLRYNLSGILPKILFRFLLKMGALPVIKLDDERPARILSYEKTKDALAQNLAKKAMEDFASQSFEKAKINFWLSILTRNDFGQVL